MDPASATSGGGLAFWLFALVVLAIAPFLLTMITSFAKLVIVGGMIRSALGMQQVPPNIVITGLALICSVHVMWPVAVASYAHHQETPAGGQSFGQIITAARGPMRDFLEHNSSPRNRGMFRQLREQLEQTRNSEQERTHAQALINKYPVLDDLTALVPAFVVTELAEAFQIGFLIYVPFLIIDLVVGNILLAMGMHYLQPTVVSAPLKLLLFVLVDGWQLIIQGLVQGYT